MSKSFAKKLLEMYSSSNAKVADLHLRSKFLNHKDVPSENIDISDMMLIKSLAVASKRDLHLHLSDGTTQFLNCIPGSMDQYENGSEAATIHLQIDFDTGNVKRMVGFMYY